MRQYPEKIREPVRMQADRRAVFSKKILEQKVNRETEKRPWILFENGKTKGTIRRKAKKINLSKPRTTNQE